MEPSPEQIVSELHVYLDDAERRAWDALSRYKFQMFGYWASIWIHLNRIARTGRSNPWRQLVQTARTTAAGLGLDVARCRVCGCTDDNACEGGCYWVQDPEGLGDLCSRCLQDLHERFEAAVRANVSLLNLGSPTGQLRAALHAQASKGGGGNANAGTRA
ncbi:MAG: hypothetical protein ACM3ZU_08175 [Bacteroidota bacterium]